MGDLIHLLEKKSINNLLARRVLESILKGG